MDKYTKAQQCLEALQHLNEIDKGTEVCVRKIEGEDEDNRVCFLLVPRIDLPLFRVQPNWHQSHHAEVTQRVKDALKPILDELKVEYKKILSEV